MLTVQEVYDLSIKLMNEQDDSTGTTDSSELDTYKNRALALINILVSELYNLSDNTSFPSTTKPIPALVTAFTDGVDLDDRLAVNVLPFGLAGYLKMGEDSENTSQTFLVKYESLKKVYAKKKPTAKVAITNVYGSLSSSVRGEITSEES
jgi:hypothetical protein